MKKFTLFFVFALIFVSHIQAKQLKESDLIKFYIREGNLENALSVINNAKIDSTFKDSLAFFKAIVYQKTGKLEPALKIFSHIVINSQDTSLVKLSEKEIFSALNKLDTSYSIEFISGILDSLTAKNIRKDFLFSLADIYERNLLYSEANDVYQTILTDTIKTDTIKILMKIALNDIYLKEFEHSRSLLDSILIHNPEADSANIFYYKALTYFKEKDYNTAQKILLDLYRKYPNHHEKWSIIYYLAKTFQFKKQYLMAWYLLDKLYKESSESQKFKLYDEIKNLKNDFLKEATATDQFRYFIPKWEVKDK